MITHHRCEQMAGLNTTKSAVSVTFNSDDGRWGFWIFIEEEAHTRYHGITIKYCPFCGEKLVHVEAGMIIQ